jgi:hypothetical protein
LIFYSAGIKFTELLLCNIFYILNFPFFKDLQLDSLFFTVFSRHSNSSSVSHHALKLILFSLYRFVKNFPHIFLIAQFLISTTENSFIVIAQETLQWSRWAKISSRNILDRKVFHFSRLSTSTAPSLFSQILSVFRVVFPIFRQNSFRDFSECFICFEIFSCKCHGQRFPREKSHFKLNRFFSSDFQHERVLGRFGLLMMFTITTTNDLKLGESDFGSALKYE